ncbi:MAG: DUF485 domain-containing protein [Thermoactinomyces sp.]
MDKIGKKDQLPHNYAKIAQSESFQKLLAAKKRFIISMTIFFTSFALLLPIMAFYTDILTRPAIGAISWAWVFAFAQFAMTWAVCHLYMKKAARFDEIRQQILEELERG